MECVKTINNKQNINREQITSAIIKCTKKEREMYKKNPILNATVEEVINYKDYHKNFKRGQKIM